MSSAKTTIDHETIQQWVEERGGTPARVKNTRTKQEPGILRIDYPGFTGGDSLEPIDWGTFFEAFDASGLAFSYQDEPNSRFSKFITREPEDDEEYEEAELMQLDAIELLESQHREVEALFEQLREATNERERKKLFVDLADNLAAHAKVEELLFYPEVCDDETADELHEAVDEHLEIKRGVADLLAMVDDDELVGTPTNSDQFAAKLDELEQLVAHHVGDEETKLFPLVREQDAVDLEELGARMEKKFAQLMRTQPRKDVPNDLNGPAELPC